MYCTLATISKEAKLFSWQFRQVVLIENTSVIIAVVSSNRKH